VFQGDTESSTLFGVSALPRQSRLKSITRNVAPTRPHAPWNMRMSNGIFHDLFSFLRYNIRYRCRFWRMQSIQGARAWLQVKVAWLKCRRFSVHWNVYTFGDSHFFSDSRLRLTHVYKCYLNIPPFQIWTAMHEYHAYHTHTAAVIVAIDEHTI